MSVWNGIEDPHIHPSLLSNHSTWVLGGVSSSCFIYQYMTRGQFIDKTHAFVMDWRSTNTLVTCDHNRQPPNIITIIILAIIVQHQWYCYNQCKLLFRLTTIVWPPTICQQIISKDTSNKLSYIGDGNASLSRDCFIRLPVLVTPSNLGQPRGFVTAPL